MRFGDIRRVRQSVTDFDVYDVSKWKLSRVEPLGGIEKHWLVDPETGCQWLFKPNTYHSHDGRVWSQREDLSEKVAYELATRVGVPCALTHLARKQDQQGCLSLDLKPPGWEFHIGSVLLDGIVEGYIPGYRPDNRSRHGHSLANITRALGQCGPPPGAPTPPEFLAFEVFGLRRIYHV